MAKVDQNMRPLLVDERVAAKMLSLSVRTLYNLRRDHALPFIRLGNVIRYRVDALEQYLRDRESIGSFRDVGLA